MPSKPLLVLGNIIAITITIAALAQALPWTIAGILILVSLALPLLVNIAPTRAPLTTHSGSKTSSVGHRETIDTSFQAKSPEKHALSSNQHVTKTEPKSPQKQPAVRPPQPGRDPVVPSIGTPHANPLGTTSPQRAPPVIPSPNLNPTIAEDDYTEYDVELDAGSNFVGEVTADGLVNVYLLDEENMDNLDEGEEFWSETGEEGVETAKLEFVALSKGKWFFVVENADDREIRATVKIQKGSASAAPA